MLKEIAKKPKRKLYNLMLTDQEYQAIKAKADKYTGGNISAWLRYTGLRYEPKKVELIPQILAPKV